MAKISKKVGKAKQMKIAKHKLFKGGSYDEVALRFGVTRDQVRNYVSKFRNEEYAKGLDADIKEEIAAERAKVSKELQENGPTTLIHETIVDFIAQVRKRGDLDLKDKLDYIGKLTMSMKRNQDMQFVEAVKKPDARRVIRLVQYFSPEATEKEILEAWKIIALEN